MKLPTGHLPVIKELADRQLIHGVVDKQHTSKPHHCLLECHEWRMVYVMQIMLATQSQSRGRNTLLTKAVHQPRSQKQPSHMASNASTGCFL